MTLRSWVWTPAEETIFHAPFTWIKSRSIALSPGTVACAVILIMGGWAFIDGFSALWVNKLPRPKFNGRECAGMTLTILAGWVSKGNMKHLWRRVPSSQASLYRLPRGEYHFHWPLFAGHPSGFGSQVRSKFTDLSLHPLVFTLRHTYKPFYLPYL